MTFRTRFAPSPTGPLHLGHAFSALTAQSIATRHDGTFLLRIDDLDKSRSRAFWETQLKDDLRWLGLDWPEPCRRQTDHLGDYTAALDRLWAAGVLYPCSCTRRDIREALSAPQEGQIATGPDGLVYPGTCRPATSPTGVRPTGVTLRLDMARALDQVQMPLGFVEKLRTDHCGEVLTDRSDYLNRIGDVVLARRDVSAAYHLAVVLDDAAQAISDVVRGADLFDATRIHALLQELLGLPRPDYWHHALIRDEHGKRLAKRDDARSIAAERNEGRSAAEIRTRLGF